MKLIRNPELRGILGMIVIILAIGAVMAVTTGKLEEWFGISFSPKLVNKIVFVSDRSGTSELYAMDPDGSEVTRLTQKADTLSAPAISASGTYVAYVAMQGSTNQVYSVGAGGGTPRQLTTATGPKKMARYTPDGRRLSYVCSGKVYVASINGESPSTVLPTKVEEHTAMSDPMRGEVPAYHDYAWAPMGEAIVGVTRDRSDSDVIAYVANPESDGLYFALRPRINEILQSAGLTKTLIPEGQKVRVAGIEWAADGETFTITVVSGTNGYLIVFSTAQGQLSVNGFKPFPGQQLSSPGLAPNGRSIVIGVSPAGGKSPGGLLRVDLSDGSAQMIASGEFENPKYSHDGEKVLAVKVDAKSGKRDVVLVDLTDGSLTELTKDGRSFDAVWSPVSEDRK